MKIKNMVDFLFKLLAFTLKTLLLFFKNLFLKFKNRNKFYVADYKNKQEKEFYFSRKLENNTYGVFCSNKKESLRIFKKPEHDNPKKLSRQYAKKIAWKKANGIN